MEEIQKKFETDLITYTGKPTYTGSSKTNPEISKESSSSCGSWDGTIVRMPSWVTDVQEPVYNGMRVIQQLGSGGFSNVFQVQHMDGSCYAMKVMPIVSNQDTLEPGHGFLRMLSEVRILRAISPHPAILKYVFSWNDNIKPWFYLVTEYCMNGNLADLLRKHRTALVPWINTDSLVDQSHCLQIIQDVAHGLKHLHSNGFVHCDIKPGNIFIHENGRAVIGDVGISTKPGNTLGYSYQSEMYTDPRFCGDSDIPVDFQMDIYSFGIVLFEAFYPFGDTEMERLKILMALRKESQIPANWCEKVPIISQLVFRCVSAASSRPSIIDIIWKLFVIALTGKNQTHIL